VERGDLLSSKSAQIRNILGKIVRAGKPGMHLCGMLRQGTGYVDHKTEFADARSVEALLRNISMR